MSQRHDWRMLYPCPLLQGALASGQASAPRPVENTSMPAIHTQALCKNYGTTAALVDLDLTVQQGEVYGYLGPTEPARRPPSACCWGCTGEFGQL